MILTVRTSHHSAYKKKNITTILTSQNVPYNTIERQIGSTGIYSICHHKQKQTTTPTNEYKRSQSDSYKETGNRN